jgi:hypothetical protein
MRLTWLAAGSALAMVLTAGAAGAYSNQFGPFAEDRRYALPEFDYPSPATADTKAEVYGHVYGDGFYEDDYFIDEDPGFWVGAGPYVYID